MQPSHHSSDGFRALGLVGNPFALPQDGSADSAGIRLSIRSAALRLLAALEDSVSDPGADTAPIIVEKSAALPAYYPVAALAQVLASLSSDTTAAGIVAAYVPLDMLRIGRVRAVLNVFAERLANNAPESSIGRWAMKALTEPDESLAEWTMLADSGFDREATMAELETDPAALAVRVFGEPVESREGAEDLETLMRVSTTRRDRLDANPDADATLTESEDATDDPLAQVFTTRLGEIDEDALTQGDVAPLDSLLAEYVVAYVKAHLSPVVARGIKAYRAQGCASMAEELKVSKAPTKTLIALLRFVEGTVRAGAVIYDRLEMWDNVPGDLQESIITSMVSLRENLVGRACLVLMLVPGAAPEVEAAFASARRVGWSFSELDSVRADDAVFDADVADSWMASAAVAGTDLSWSPDLLAAVPEGTLWGPACEALSAALESAAQAGRVPDPAVVTAAFERT